MFCPKCSTLLRPRMDKGKKVFGCSCGYTQKAGNTAISEKGAQHKNIEIVEEMETKPVVDAVCDCGHNKAYFWSMQTRAADEPETRFFKCVKCKHTWREYK